MSITNINILKKGFAAISLNDIPVSNDPLNLTIFNNLDISYINGFEYDNTTGAFINRSSKILNLFGTCSMQPVISSTSKFYLFSQRSFDGINWTQQDHSLRTFEFTNNAESFISTISLSIGLEPNQYLRFVCFSDSNGIVISTTSVDVGLETMTGASFAWFLQEQ